MNIIGIFGPKILTLLTIWIPPYDISGKLLLSFICGVKLMWDYERNRPGNKGFAYRLTSRFCIDTQEIIICAMGLCVSLAFGVAAFRYSAWIPAILGLVSIVSAIYETAAYIKGSVTNKNKKQSHTKLLTAVKFNGSSMVSGCGKWLQTSYTIFSDGSYEIVSTCDETNGLPGEKSKPKQDYIEKGSLSPCDLAELKRLLKDEFKLCKGSMAFDADWWEITSYDDHGVTEHKYVGTTNFSGDDTTINAIGQIIPQGMLDNIRPDRSQSKAVLGNGNKTGPTVECENDQHEYIIAEAHTGYTRYVCKKCGKVKHWDSLAPDIDVLTLEPDEGPMGIPEESEYVILDPEKTVYPFPDTLELYMRHSGETVKFQKQQIEVGREKCCDLRLENPYIARKQATFFYENKTWFLRDNHTTNGTYINGTKLQPMKKYQLAANDVIGFAGKSVEVVFYRTEKTIEPAGDADAKAIAILEAAIKVFFESKFNDDPALKLIVASLLKAPLYFPVAIDVAAMLEGLDPTKLKAGDTIQPQKDVKMRILTLKMDDGSEIVPMFTSSEKAQKHQSVSTMRQYPQDYIAALLQMNKTVIINPFDEFRFIMIPDFLKNVLAPLITKASSEPAASNPVPQPASDKKEDGGLENRLIDGKYRILKRISRVSLVEVYMAMNEHINQVCAVKVCSKMGKNPMMHELILNEALAMMKLDHPAIPKIYDIVEDESYTYIIREYIQGETLDVILKNFGAQPVDLVVDWSKQLCDVLGYLHGLNPPHIYRDMKPANVLLQPDGRVRLIDFETIRLYDEKKDYDTTALGTKGYAAPEQYGGAGQIDARTDIFGLGMTMHYLLTGVNPIDPPYITQPIRKIDPELPVQLEAIIQKCIEPDREKRYQTVDSLLRALNGEPDSAE